MASGTATSDVTDGPVLTLINKRIRNLRKKLNRIAQLEDSIAQGKSNIKNKEQEELLKSKPGIIAAVDELEKFRQPLSVAVDEEITLALQRRQASASEDNDNDEDSSKAQTLDKEQPETEPPAVPLDDLLSLIYIGSMFDVKSQNDFNSIMLTRTHERNCCLTYDYVTDDDAAVMLGERDLDLISTMGSLLISRPVDSSLSHSNALQMCIHHAKLWLAKSEQQIDPNSNVTYAELREKLTKIMGSDYFKITPEMKAPADVAAEAAGNYSTFQVPVQVEGSVTQYEHKEDDVTDHQRSDEDQSAPIEDSHKDQQEAENSTEIPVQEEPTEQDDNKEQPLHRRSYHNQRGGGGTRGRRGYSNGRGGRSGGRGGPYQNGGGGRNTYYEQQGNYYPRNYHGSGGGGGGRGRGGSGGRGNYGNSYNNNNNHASGVEAGAES